MRRNSVVWRIGLIICLAIVLYPPVVNRYYEDHQSLVLTEYREEMEAAELSEEKEACIRYNEVLREAVSVQKKDGGGWEMTSEKEGYEERLRQEGTEVMGYLEIPKLELILPICHGVDEKTLERALGHLPESSLPVGGVGTHAVLTGHSGLSDRRLFTDLEELEAGDHFWVYVLDECHSYEVDRIMTVLPEETGWFQIEEGKDEVTLVTCTPYGINTHRLLVRGHRVREGEEEESIRKEEMLGERGSVWYSEYKKAVEKGVLLSVFLTAAWCGIWMRKKRRKKGGGKGCP